MTTPPNSTGSLQSSPAPVPAFRSRHRKQADSPSTTAFRLPPLGATPPSERRFQAAEGREVQPTIERPHPAVAPCGVNAALHTRPALARAPSRNDAVGARASRPLRPCASTEAAFCAALASITERCHECPWLAHPCRPACAPSGLEAGAPATASLRPMTVVPQPAPPPSTGSRRREEADSPLRANKSASSRQRLLVRPRDALQPGPVAPSEVNAIGMHASYQAQSLCGGVKSIVPQECPDKPNRLAIEDIQPDQAVGGMLQLSILAQLRAVRTETSVFLSSVRNGEEGRGEEALRKVGAPATVKHPSPHPSPRSCLTGRGRRTRYLLQRSLHELSQRLLASQLSALIHADIFIEQDHAAAKVGSGWRSRPFSSRRDNRASCMLSATAARDTLPPQACTMASTNMPRSNSSRICQTMMRVPLNVGFPWQIFGSATMYWPSSSRCALVFGARRYRATQSASNPSLPVNLSQVGRAVLSPPPPTRMSLSCGGAVRTPSPTRAGSMAEHAGLADWCNLSRRYRVGMPALSPTDFLVL